MPLTKKPVAKALPIVPAKRPRGRPPLLANKRKLETIAADKNLVHSSTALPPLPPVQMQSHHRQEQILLEIKNSKVHVAPTVSVTTPVSSSVTDVKVKTGQQYAVEKIFSKLQTENPLTITQLCYLFPDLPKEIIVATLEILQVLGFVFRVKSGKGLDSITAYTVHSFSKASEAVDIHKMEEATAAKSRNVQAIEERIQKLQVTLISCFSNNILDCFYVYFPLQFQFP